MNVEEQNYYRDFLIRSLPNAKEASGGREVNCRCLYHDDHSRHMYLNVPEDNKPLVFYCQKCQTKGYVNPARLNEWNIYDDEVAAIIQRHSKISKKFVVDDSRLVYTLRNSFVNDDKLSKVKLDYINSRIGTNLSYNDCNRLKICLNLKDLLRSNNITRLTRNESIVNELDINFVGFISLDNAFVNMRRIVEEGKVYQSIDKRYINYSLFGKFDNLERFYTIPTNINLYDPNRVPIHIAEGPFDILSIYLNVRNREPGIYTSIAGNNYIGIIKHFMITMRLPYIRIELYPDNPTEKDSSGDDRHMKSISDYCKMLGIPVTIHRNKFEGEKDFGVTPDRIKEVTYTL